MANLDKEIYKHIPPVITREQLISVVNYLKGSDDLEIAIFYLLKKERLDDTVIQGIIARKFDCHRITADRKIKRAKKTLTNFVVRP